MLINKIYVLKLLPVMIMASRFSIPYLPYLALSLFQLLRIAVATTLVKSNSVLILVYSYLIIMIPVGSNSPHSPMPENHYLSPQKSSISTSRISLKAVIIRKQRTPNFPKKSNVCLSGRTKYLFFIGKISALYFLVTTVLFEICCFILLPTNTCLEGF